MTERRRGHRVYNGRNAGLLVVGAVVLTFVLFNLLGRATQPKPSGATPSPAVTHARP